MVHVDNATLKQAFQELGFHKLSILFSAADGEARGKILANLSRKIAAVVSEEARTVTVEDTALADLEAELFNVVRTIKKG